MVGGREGLCPHPSSPGVIVEDILDALAMVDIPVDNENPKFRQCWGLLEGSSCLSTFRLGAQPGVEGAGRGSLDHQLHLFLFSLGPQRLQVKLGHTSAAHISAWHVWLL